MATSAASAVDTIGLQAFMKILATQLTYQDPLKPMDNQEFIAQMAQFAGLEQSREQNQKLEQILFVQSASQSVGMLGKQVNATLNGQGVQGRVTALDFDSGTALLTIVDGQGKQYANVTLSQIQRLQNPQ
jgi:flagellar basal-body rod modification protein FlgD